MKDDSCSSKFEARSCLRRICQETGAPESFFHASLEMVEVIFSELSPDQRPALIARCRAAAVTAAGLEQNRRDCRVALQNMASSERQHSSMFRRGLPDSARVVRQRFECIDWDETAVRA